MQDCKYMKEEDYKRKKQLCRYCFEEGHIMANCQEIRKVNKKNRYEQQECPNCRLLLYYDHIVWYRGLTNGWTCNCNNRSVITPETLITLYQPQPITLMSMDNIDVKLEGLSVIEEDKFNRQPNYLEQEDPPQYNTPTTGLQLELEPEKTY